MLKKLDVVYSYKKSYFNHLLDLLWALFSLRIMSSDLLFRIADGSVATLKILNLVELTVIFLCAVFHLYGVVYKKITIYEELFTDITAALWMIGFAFYERGDWDILIGSVSRILFSTIVWIGLRKLILLIADICKNVRKEILNKKIAIEIKPWISRIILWTAYIPWIIIRFPAAMECDAYYQIEEALGFCEMSGQWPPLSCVLMGGVVGLGERITGSYDIGACIYVVLQTAICVEILCYSLKSMQKLGVNSVFSNLVVIVYAVSTSYSAYITSIVKDTLFSMFVLLFVMLLTELLNKVEMSKLLTIGATGLIMCCLRNNGVYLVGICLIGVACYCIKNRGKQIGKILLVFISIMVCYEIYIQIFLPSIGIVNSGIDEAMSIPFQQTARYAKEHSDDITDEEWKILNDTLVMDGLAEVYDPLISDPVKRRYDSSKYSLGPYFKVWAAQLLRHPDTYFASVFHNSYGFYYPFSLDTAAYGVYEKLDLMEYHLPENTKRIKYGLYCYIKTVDEIPVIRLINSCGLMAWITLFLFMYVVHKKNGKNIIVLLVPFLSIFICVASPTFASNGTRYALPIIYTVPYLMGTVLFIQKENVDL